MDGNFYHNLSTERLAMESFITDVTDMLTYLEKGGFIMIPLLLCSILALAIVLVKIVHLRRRKIVTPELITVIRSLRSPDDIAEAKQICLENGGPFSRMVLTGLENGDLPHQEVQELLEDQGRQEVKLLEKGLVSLETIASITPLLGLLGTVLGMVDVFNQIALSDSVKATQLSDGISKALITTVVGLSIGIPSLVAYNFLLSRAENLIIDIEKYSSQLLLKLRRMRRQPEQNNET